jgi:hypothetical protein
MAGTIVIGGRRRNRSPRTPIAEAIGRRSRGRPTSHSLLDVSSVRRREVTHTGGQSPGSKEWSGKAGAARGDTPTDNRAHPNVSTETGLAHSQGSMTCRLGGGISSGPDLRGDEGGRNGSRGLRAATGWLATARNHRLAQKQPPVPFDSASPVGRTGMGAGAREGHAGPLAPNPTNVAACVRFPTWFCRGQFFGQFEQAQTLRSGTRSQKNR